MISITLKEDFKVIPNKEEVAFREKLPPLSPTLKNTKKLPEPENYSCTYSYIIQL